LERKKKGLSRIRHSRGRKRGRTGIEGKKEQSRGELNTNKEGKRSEKRKKSRREQEGKKLEPAHQQNVLRDWGHEQEAKSYEHHAIKKGQEARNNSLYGAVEDNNPQKKKGERRAEGKNIRSDKKMEIS